MNTLFRQIDVFISSSLVALPALKSALWVCVLRVSTLRISALKVSAMLFFFCAVLNGCGHKGDLVLPQDKQSAELSLTLTPMRPTSSTQPSTTQLSTAQLSTTQR
ncbi:MAG: LPS translocon maturation chaperone LptM [Cellvibrionaceae bacterium]